MPQFLIEMRKRQSERAQEWKLIRNIHELKDAEKKRKAREADIDRLKTFSIITKSSFYVFGQVFSGKMQLKTSEPPILALFKFWRFCAQRFPPCEAKEFLAATFSIKLKIRNYFKQWSSAEIAATMQCCHNQRHTRKRVINILFNAEQKWK